MPGEGVEPTRISPEDFKSSASAYSATPAWYYILLLTGAGFNYWLRSNSGLRLVTYLKLSVLLFDYGDLEFSEPFSFIFFVPNSINIAFSWVACYSVAVFFYPLKSISVCL